jgi:hypothetical protein
MIHVTITEYMKSTEFVFTFSDRSIKSDEGTSPSVRSFLDRVYVQTIELSELLNTIEWLSFLVICCRVMGLLLDFGL